MKFGIIANAIPVVSPKGFLGVLDKKEEPTPKAIVEQPTYASGMSTPRQQVKLAELQIAAHKKRAFAKFMSGSSNGF